MSSFSRKEIGGNRGVSRGNKVERRGESGGKEGWRGVLGTVGLAGERVERNREVSSIGISTGFFIDFVTVLPCVCLSPGEFSGRWYFLGFRKKEVGDIEIDS